MSACDEEGCTALHQAVRFAYGPILNWLIENGNANSRAQCFLNFSGLHISKTFQGNLRPPT